MIPRPRGVWPCRPRESKTEPIFRIPTAKRSSSNESYRRHNFFPHPHMSLTFDYTLDYKNLDLRKHPELYRTGKGEQGVLLVEPYKSEILPHWKFNTTDVVGAKRCRKIFK